MWHGDAAPPPPPLPPGVDCWASSCLRCFIRVLKMWAFAVNEPHGKRNTHPSSTSDPPTFPARRLFVFKEWGVYGSAAVGKYRLPWRSFQQFDVCPEEWKPPFDGRSKRHSLWSASWTHSTVVIRQKELFFLQKLPLACWWRMWLSQLSATSSHNPAQIAITIMSSQAKQPLVLQIKIEAIFCIAGFCSFGELVRTFDMFCTHVWDVYLVENLLWHRVLFIIIKISLYQAKPTAVTNDLLGQRYLPLLLVFFYWLFCFLFNFSKNV